MDDEPVEVDLEHWRDFAACAGLQEIFYPGQAESTITTNRREQRCLRVCRECPVREPCLEEALSSPDNYHDLVMGGYTGPGRRSIRRAANMNRAIFA